jgi:hypothetical protein
MYSISDAMAAALHIAADWPMEKHMVLLKRDLLQNSPSSTVSLPFAHLIKRDRRANACDKLLLQPSASCKRVLDARCTPATEGRRDPRVLLWTRLRIVSTLIDGHRNAQHDRRLDSRVIYDMKCLFSKNVALIDTVQCCM